MESYVKSSLDQGVGTITLARPDKRNALKRDFIVQLTEAVDTLSADSELRLLVFRAAGSVFCAGMDLGEMQERATSDDGKIEWQKDSEVYAQLLKKVFELSVPTVVVLQGPVLAGGVGLVLACDMIIAADNAFVMLPEPMRGITAAMVTPFLVYRVGAGTASEILLSGRRYPAERCHQLGLIHACCPASELDATVDAYTASILTGSQAALAITKQHIRHCAGSQISEQLEKSIAVSAEARETRDAREGLAAFLEKRKPAWQPGENN